MRFSFWTVVAVVAWLILVSLLIVSLGFVLLSSPEVIYGSLHPGELCALLRDPAFPCCLRQYAHRRIGGLVGSLVLGSIMAFCIARFEIRGGRFVSLLAIFALVSPPFIGAYSWIVLFGSGGLVAKR